MCKSACEEMQLCISSRFMTLRAEVIDMEAALKRAGVSLDAVLAQAGINRSTWTRWKAGTVKGARYDTISRVKDAAHRAVEAASQDAAA